MLPANELDWGWISLVTAVALNFISLSVSVYFVMIAVAAIRYRGGENLELIILLFAGVPTLFVQGIIVPFVIAFLSRAKQSVRPKQVWAGWLVYVSLLLPVVTFLAILYGLILEEMTHFVE